MSPPPPRSSSSSLSHLTLPVLFVLALFFLFVNRVWLVRFFWNSLYTLSFFEYGASRNVDECRLLLWTNGEQENKAEVVDRLTKEALDRTRFNRTLPVKIFIHGFSDSPEAGWILQLRNAYFKRASFNVISVDWYNLTTSPWYTIAVKNGRLVGLYISRVVSLLREEGISWEDIHLLGYSLGGQVAGHAGYFTRGRLGRITGLDPSGPLFHAENKDGRLDSSDAQFVDVVHAAGRWVAMDEQSGHVDFFPNLGRAPQPGCRSHESLNLICSHALAWRFFLESVDPPVVVAVVPDRKFYALGCSSSYDFTSGRCCSRLGRVWTRRERRRRRKRRGRGQRRRRSQIPHGVTKVAVMGDPVDRSIRGRFYLYTNQDPIYAKDSFEESTRCCCDNRTEVCHKCN